MSNPQKNPTPGSSFVAQFGHLLPETVSQELITQWVTDTAQQAVNEPKTDIRAQVGQFYRAHLVRADFAHTGGHRLHMISELVYQVGAIIDSTKKPDKRLVGPIFCQNDGRVYVKRKEITATYGLNNSSITTALQTGKPTSKAGLVLRPATEEEITQLTALTE